MPQSCDNQSNSPASVAAVVKYAIEHLTRLVDEIDGVPTARAAGRGAAGQPRS